MDTSLNEFLKHGAAQQFSTLQVDTPNTFGKMNVLQMLEHLAEYISVSSGKIKLPLQTELEHLPKWKAFLLSDKEFRPNTPNSLMSDTPPPATITTVSEGVEMVQAELDRYFERFDGKEMETEVHPFFGALNFEEWAMMHGKHIRHHMRQFGIGNN